MNKKTIIICGWTLTALAAFGLGWGLKSGASEATQTSNNVGTISGSKPLLGGGRSVSKNEEQVEQPKTPSDFFSAFTKEGAVSAEDMPNLMKAILDENDPLKRASLFSQLLEQLTPENALAAYTALREKTAGFVQGGRGGRGGGGGGLGRGGNMNNMQLMLNAWGRVDGAGAVEALMAQNAESEGEEGGGRGRGGPGGRGGQDFRGVFELYGAVTGWATADVSAAASFVDGLESAREKQMLSNGIVQGLLVNSVDDAVDYVASLPADNESRNRYMASIASEMMEKGSSAAAGWADGLSDPALKSGAMEQIAGQFANDDLDSAIDWVAKHAGQDYANGAVTEVAERWAEDDPQSAMEWANSLPENARAGVYKEALDEWTERDPLAASEYLAKLQPSPEKDSAVEGFATELAREDPESAIVWAETISNEELRVNTMTDVVGSWIRSDKAAATDWLQQSTLSTEAQQQILESSTSRRDGGGRRGRGGR